MNKSNTEISFAIIIHKYFNTASLIILDKNIKFEDLINFSFFFFLQAKFNFQSKSKNIAVQLDQILTTIPRAGNIREMAGNRGCIIETEAS